MDTNTLKYQFGVTDYVLQKAVAGISHEDSLKAPTPAGNCANWVLGHLVRTHITAVELTGKTPELSKEQFAQYDRGAPPISDAAKAVPFGELVETFTNLQKALMEGLDQVTGETMNQKAPFSPLDNPDETVGSLLAGISFHQAYHVGQLGILRRVAGKEGAVG